MYLLPQSQQQLWRTAKAHQRASPRNSVSWQISCRQKHQAVHCSMEITRKQCKTKWTATLLADWGKFGHRKWDRILVAVNDYVQTHWTTRSWSSVSASITGICADNFLSLCGLITAGRRNGMEKSVEMQAFLKMNKRLLEWHEFSLRLMSCKLM